MASPEIEPAQLPQAPGAEDAPALAIGRLYESHHRMVRALCQLLLRNPADAEDAAQQTFLSAFGSLIDGTTPRNPAAWLATIARRECWARTAQRRRQPLQLGDTDGDPETASALDEAIHQADLTALWKAINELPRQQRAAFLLREFSGLSYAEVAEALGASESAIESLLVRARRQLRDGLEPALKAANLLATPVLLLRHRLTRLLDPRLAGGTVGTAAATSVGIKLGATVAGTALVVASSVGVAIHTLGRHARAHASSRAHVAGAGSGALDRHVGGASTLDPTLWLSGPNLALALAVRGPGVEVATSSANVDPAPGSMGQETGTTRSPASGGSGGSETTSSDPTTSTSDGQPSPGSTDPTDPTTDGSQPSESPGDATGTDTTPADTTPADTTATDTTPADTSPIDTTTVDSAQSPIEPPQPDSPAGP